MKTVSLNGNWKLYSLPEDGFSVEDPQELKRIEAKSMIGRVPGNVELDLMREGKLPDLFVGENIYKLKAYEHYTWWYTRDFETPQKFAGKEVKLVFQGIDCIAAIWLNGVKIGQIQNMLVEHDFDVTDLLRCGGSNNLSIQIKSPVNVAKAFSYEPSHWASVTNYEQLFIRKPPHMYGWDIAPRAVSAGIWRSVELQIHDDTEIVNLVYATEHLDGENATLFVGWQFRTEAEQIVDFVLRFTGHCGESEFFHTEKACFIAGSCMINVTKATLWWPKGYGEANLYRVKCELIRDGKIVDARTDEVGLRSIELERSEMTTAREGGQFLFRINGVPIMCKGTNWVPLDAFHSRDAERYQPVLQLVDEVGCNIVRCWGGNVYEDTEFYRFCDRHGIMVWQDFSFACGLYPQDAVFHELVRSEAQKVVHKLRNHPCIILWAGDNEVDVFYLRRSLDPANNKISRQVLLEICAECDPFRPYLPSSPYASPEVVRSRSKGQELMPEQHLWGPRDYFKSRFYAENTAHFASEIGYHGCPSVSSIKRFIEPDYLWPWKENKQWRVHASDPVPSGGRFQYRIKLMANQIAALFGSSPDNLEDFALASQICQAEANKFFIEMFRIKKWRKTGIIWWNIMDCWPQFSDAIVDYYFVKKLAYWYIKRVQVPVCIMIDEPQDRYCRVIVGNDSRETWHGTYNIVDGLGGETLLSGRFKTAINENRELGKIPVSPANHRLFLITWKMNGCLYGNHYLLGKPPFSFSLYRSFLREISELPPSFNLESIAK